MERILSTSKYSLARGMESSRALAGTVLCRDPLAIREQRRISIGGQGNRITSGRGLSRVFAENEYPMQPLQHKKPVLGSIRRNTNDTDLTDFHG